MPEKKNKEEEKKPEYFTIEVEALIPATLKYRILAKTPEEAIELINRNNPEGPPKFNIVQMRKRVARVYKWGTRIIEHIKRW